MRSYLITFGVSNSKSWFEGKSVPQYTNVLGYLGYITGNNFPSLEKLKFTETVEYENAMTVLYSAW